MNAGCSLEASMIAIGWDSRTGGTRQAEVVRLIIGRAGKVCSPGSPGLRLAWAAIGRVDAAFYEMDFGLWDLATGSLLCQRAGLVVRQAPPAAPDASPRLLATPPHLESDLVDLLGAGPG